MPFTVQNEGNNNVVSIVPESLARLNGRLVLAGDDNLVSIGIPYACGSIDIRLDGGSSLSILDDCILGNLFVYAVNRGHVRIGTNTKFHGHVRLMLHEPGTIAIGDGCLFGSGTEATISDMHSIISIDTGKRVNPARDIEIGDRVWTGSNVTILKGVSVGAGSFVGASAVVTRDIPANCGAAGNPARVVRDRVTWREELI